MTTSPPKALLKAPDNKVVVALVLVMGLLVACGGSPTSSADRPTVFKATDAGFSAEFPSKPQRTASTHDTTTEVRYEALSANAAEDVIVQYLASPGPMAGVTQTLLDQQMDGSASAVSGTVVSRASLTFLGRQAEDGVIQSPNGHAIRMRAFFVPSGDVEQYFVLSGGAATLDAAHPAYDRLLATFQLTS
ncbi:MAG TPA: hypothetical protein VG779_05025 [Actinomycetota bacterium]|nr:hypothetical protein [Actinomycetota bacterium]